MYTWWDLVSVPNLERVHSTHVHARQWHRSQTLSNCLDLPYQVSTHQVDYAKSTNLDNTTVERWGFWTKDWNHKENLDSTSSSKGKIQPKGQVAESLSVLISVYSAYGKYDQIFLFFSSFSIMQTLKRLCCMVWITIAQADNRTWYQVFTSFQHILRTLSISNQIIL